MNMEPVRSYETLTHLHKTTMRHAPEDRQHLPILKFRIIPFFALFYSFLPSLNLPFFLRLLLFQCPDLRNSAYRHLGTVYANPTLVSKETCLSGPSALSHSVINVCQNVGLISFRTTESNLVASARTSLITPLYDTHPGPSSLTKPPPRTSPLRRLDAKHS